jgi:hypothetical protein
MAKNNLWNYKKNRRSITAPGYEGGAEKLLQYADAHPSVRELGLLKIKAELRRWDIELRPPTLEEIQHRFNFTTEYAEKFLKKLHKARSTKTQISPEKNVKHLNQTIAPATILSGEPIDQEGMKVKDMSDSLNAILAAIRIRYGEEIRQKGEQTSAKEGFIYLVKNPCFPGWLKAGMTIDYELRLSTYNTSDPLSRFEYVKLVWTPDRRESERTLLNALQQIAEKRRGEWFSMQRQDALFVFENCKSVT